MRHARSRAGTLVLLLLVVLAPPLLSTCRWHGPADDAGGEAGAGGADKAAARIEAVLQRALEVDGTQSVVIIVDEGVEVLAAGHGVEDVETGVPLSPRSVMRAASLTKLLTQVAVMVLVDAGRIDLDAPVVRYRPDFRSASGSAMTVRHLLAMESGLPRELSGDSATSGVAFDDDGRVGPFLDGLDLRLQFEPGAGRAYSNVAYWVLGGILEAVTGRTYEEAVQELVLDPLGMDDTGFGVDDPAAAGHAAGHARDDDGELQRVPTHPIRQRYASGGAHSTPRDMERLFRSFSTAAILSGPSRLLVCRRFGDEAPEDVVLAGSGHVPGFAHHITYDLGRERLVLLMTNVDVSSPGPVLDLHGRIVRALDGVEEPADGGSKVIVLEVRSARDGLPDTPLGNAATRWLEAVASGDADRIVETRLALSPGGPDVRALRDISRQLAGLARELGGWDVAGYLEQPDASLLVVVRGTRSEARITFRPEDVDPGLIADIEIDIHPRR